MEVIKQRVNYIDGIPIYKCGEWPGKLSSHWNSSKMIIKHPEPKENKINNFERLISGKRHFSIGKQIEKEYRPIVKIHKEQYKSNHINHILDKDYNYLDYMKLGLKHIEPNYKQPKTYLRKCLDSNNISAGVEEIFHSKKKIPQDSKGKNEYTVENSLGGKARLTSLQAIRNGIEIVSPGDKIYKSVEYSPRFFQEGGLVPGSTIGINYKKTITIKSDNFYDSLDLTVKSLDPEKLWNFKCLKSSLDVDDMYVKGLKQWEGSYLNPIEETKENIVVKQIQNNITKQIPKESLIKLKSKF